ncbi:MAG: DNA cytosine methyltransferase [Deltaproteobacteria bacterium]|nr:DNA cytosine methyltransferase [Deltaproteobacteria bacterium]
MPDGTVKKLGPRAIARLQGLPDTYPLPDRTATARVIIGNGVPPPLAKAVFGPMLEAIATPDVLYQSARRPDISPLGLFDNIGRAMDGWQPRGTPEQLKAYLAKVHGAAQEAADIGLDQWLADKQTITREQVRKFVEDHEVKVEEAYGVNRYKRYTEPGGSNYQELLLTAKPLAGNDFRSRHFPELKNIIAHLRVKDRTLPDGRKVLFAEEVQSDWQQLARKKGVVGQDYVDAVRAETQAKVKLDAAKAELAELAAQERESGIAHSKALRAVRAAGGDVDAFIGSPEEMRLLDENTRHYRAWEAKEREVSALDYERIEAWRKVDYLHGDRAASPPLRNAGWKRLAIKRLLAYAAEHGYDAIAWTTGETQAKRYDLEHLVDALAWKHIKKDNRFDLWVEPKGGGEQTFVGWFTPDELEAQIGKDAASNIVRAAEAGEVSGELRGPDLAVGGHGMRGFYDRELKNLANDIAKQYGQKVGVGKVSTGVELAGPYFDSYSEKWVVETLGEDVGYMDFVSREEAAKWAAENQGKIDAHILPVPEAMRAKINAEGLPLYQPAKGAVEFLADGTALIRALKSPDASTGVHELAHVARRQVLNEAGGFTPDEIAQAEAWAGAKGGVWDTAAEEKFARGFERYLRDGTAPTKALAKVFAKFKDWLTKVYATLTGSAIDINISPEMRSIFDKMVQRGEKLGDAAPEAPTRMVARDDRSGMIGQRGDLHDLLPEVPKSRRQSIEDAARQAGLAGRDAFAAGFDPNKPAEWIAEPSALSDDDMDAIGALLDAGDDAGAEALEKSLTAARAAKAKAKAADQFSAWKQANRLPDDASVYQVGRTIADYLFGRNVTDPQVLSSMLKEIGVPERAANAAATFLWAEAETRARAKMVEPSYGGIRRPTPEVTRWSVAKDGSLVEMPEARSLDVARDATLSGPGAARQGRNYLHEMASRQLVPEAPKPVTTDNPVINGAIAKVAEVIKSAYYTDDLAPTDARAMGPVADATGMPTPQQWVQQANQGLKELTQERIAQRVLEAFDADTTQTLRSAKIRNALLDLARSRLRDAGVSGAAARKALVGILKELESPDRVGALSKSRFPEVYANGKPIITRADFSTVNAKAAPKIIGEVIKSIADDMAEATFGYHTLRDMSAEVYRFMTTPEGNVDANVVGSATRYAAKMADRVLRDGEIHPTMMPYSGEKVASALRTLAADGGLSHLPTDKVLALADFVERFRPASETGGLADQIGSWMSNLYRSTQPPPKMHNVHIEPNALASLRGHFGMLTSAEAPGVLGLVRAIGQHTKKAVVALNFPSLVNNDLANLIVQGFRRADPMQPVKALKVAVAYKAYRDGKYGLLDPRTIRIFKALDQTDMFNQSDIAADIGRTEVWRQLEATIPQTATARRKLSVGTHGMSEVPGRVLDSVNDALAEAYTKLGDSPFRLEEAVNAYNAFESKVLLLKEGEWLDLATGDARTTRIERTPTGFAVVDLSAPHAKRRVTLGESVQSPQLTQALADAANVAQERPFFNYSRIGNMGKYLRGGPFSLLSGIFSWFFKSVDVPGLKRGMMSEIMSHPYQVKTNSAAVLSEQAANNRAMALRRSMAVSMARAALGPQRDREELRRAMGWNAAEVGTVLRAASNPMDIDNPTHLWTRNVNPVVSVAPSAVVWGLGQYLASKAAFGDILDDPATLAKTLRPDDELTPSQLQSKRLLLKMARSETFSPKQGFQLLGLGGGPLLTLMERLKNSGQRGQHISGHEAIYEFSKLMFGATPVKAVDVGLGAAGSPWSTYGKDFAKQGFHGGQPPDDASGFARWALRQLVGAGYQRVAIEDGENVETGGTLHGKLRNYLQQAKTTAKATLLAEAKRRANLAGQALSASPSDKVLIKAREDAIGLVNTLGDVIDTEFDAYKQRLDDQFRSLGPAEKRWLDNRR